MLEKIIDDINDGLVIIEMRVLESNLIYPSESLLGPIEINSEIKSLYEDIERTRVKLDQARQNPSKYASIIDTYEVRIAEDEGRIKELEESSLSVDGGPQRPKQDFGDQRGAYSIAKVIEELMGNLRDSAYNEDDLTQKLNDVGWFLDKYRMPQLRKIQQRRTYRGPGHSTFGNFEVELDIPGLPEEVKFIERYDFGGHSTTGRKGPHIQYDLVLWDPILNKGVKPLPMGPKDPRSLGTGDKDFISLGYPQEALGYRIEGIGLNRKITYLTK